MARFQTPSPIFLLDLNTNSFSGSIPDLGNLRLLQRLYLWGNKLSGAVAPFLSSLTNCRYLEEFEVSYNQLNGVLPASIGNFSSSLESIWLQNNNITGNIPSEIGNLSSLLELYLLSNRLSGSIPPTTGKLMQLQRLYIDDNQLVGSIPSDLCQLNNLGVLSIAMNKLVGPLPVCLGELKSLREVYLYSNQLNSTIPPNFWALTDLVILDLSFNNFNGDIPNNVLLAYMPNGSLDRWLHSNTYSNFDLLQRVKIAIDVAAALEYLHHGYSFPIVHCDVKPSNVLLDQDMIAHLSDFGISKLFEGGEAFVHTQTLATIGYAAPEFGREGKVSTEGDVYSFGILVLEMFTGKKPTDDTFGGEMSLIDWVSEALRQNAATEIVPLSREDRDFSAKEQCLNSIFELAMKCSANSADERINMIEAAATLHKINAAITAATRRRRPRYALSIIRRAVSIQ